jgi:hypothetical protein
MHLNDTPHLSHAAWSLSNHYFNMLSIKAHYEEQGMAVPPHYLAEITRVDTALRELLANGEARPRHYPTATATTREKGELSRD